MQPARVLVVDDSALVREMLTSMLAADPRLEVVGAAHDAFSARHAIKSLKPDVLTLDVQMPQMDGIQFLRNLMRLHPMPVVMVSAFTVQGAEVTLQALELGALDVVSKPTANDAAGLQEYARDLAERVYVASRARLQTSLAQAPAAAPFVARASRTPADTGAGEEPGQALIAIGASTGGPAALRQLFQALPSDLPGIVAVQHIPADFVGALAERLNQTCPLAVKVPQHGEVIKQGHAYLSAGDRHLRVELEGGQLRCVFDDGAPVNRHKPSVDVMFRSVCEVRPRHVAALLLTGMGTDGARGLKALREVGALTIAQSERSSAVWGMPREAVELDAVDEVLDLEAMPAALTRFSSMCPKRRYGSQAELQALSP